MKILPTLLFSLTLSFSLAQAADAPKGAGAGAGGGQGREKMKEMMLQKFDTNKNGTLDPDEKEAAMKAMQERKGGAPGAKGGAPGAKGGAGTAKGGGQMQEMLLQKFDANKNGVLDPDEKAAAAKAMQERRGQAGGSPGAGAGTNSEGGSKFRRPPTTAKEGAAK